MSNGNGSDAMDLGDDLVITETTRRYAGAGTWVDDADDGKVTVNEGDGDADCVISTSAETFRKIASREQNPTAAYMSGKLKVKGDMGQAMKLQKLF